VYYRSGEELIEAKMSKRDKAGDLDEIFEILVTSYAQKGGVIPGESDMCWRPATDAYETAEHFIVQVDLAGMDPAQIEGLADENSRVVRGIRQESAVPGKKHFHTMEINVGPFVRRVPITVDVDPSSASAKYRSGFLYVSFVKGSGNVGDRRQISIDR
jgi:HSP20 family protein